MPQRINLETAVPVFSEKERVLKEGPLLPFDYCYLSGMNKGLLLEVQMELVLRNPRLVLVDRSPLGVDPNAALSRCYLAFGNPHEKVPVYNFYENDICRGVPLDYFNKHGVRRRLDDIYQDTGWAQGLVLSSAAQDWLSQYHAALALLSEKIAEAENRNKRVQVLDEFAGWLIPLVFFNHNPKLKKYANIEQKVLKDIFRSILGDYTILSIVNRTTFCVLASIEEIFYKDEIITARKDTSIFKKTALFKFKPRRLKTAVVLLLAGLIIANIASKKVISSDGLPILAAVLALAGIAIFVLNFVYWIFFTSKIKKLEARVSAKWKVPIKKIPGYLK